MKNLKKLCNNTILSIVTAVALMMGVVVSAQAKDHQCPSGSTWCGPTKGCCSKNCCGRVVCISVSYPHVSFVYQAAQCTDSKCATIADCPK